MSLVYTWPDSEDDPLDARILSETRTQPDPLHSRYSGQVGVWHHIRLVEYPSGMVVLEVIRYDASSRSNIMHYNEHMLLDDALLELALLPQHIIPPQLYNFAIDDLNAALKVHAIAVLSAHGVSPYKQLARQS